MYCHYNFNINLICISAKPWCRHWALGRQGGEGGGEGCSGARAAPARHDCRGWGCPGGQGQSYRGRGRAQGEQGAQTGCWGHSGQSRSSPAALPADPQQHLCREQLHHRVPSPYWHHVQLHDWQHQHKSLHTDRLLCHVIISPSKSHCIIIRWIFGACSQLC